MPISYPTPGTDSDEHHILPPVRVDGDEIRIFKTTQHQCAYCARRWTESSRDTEAEILSRAISHYGEPAQVLKCIEELAELINILIECHLTCDESEFITGVVLGNISIRSEYIAKACREYLPEIRATLRLENVEQTTMLAGELADVSLTTSQMLKIFNCSGEVERIKQEKLSRLEARMRPSNPLDCESIGEDETFEDIHGPVDGGDFQ